MNKERLQACIDIMKRAENLQMDSWQNGGYHTVQSIEELHACGNTACFAGYVAMSPEFKEFGGIVGLNGEPVVEREDIFKLSGSDAICQFLEIPRGSKLDDIMSDLVGDNFERGNTLEHYVDCHWRDWETKHVIKILQGIKNNDPELFAHYGDKEM